MKLTADRFPRASQYNPEWLLASASGGANALWLTEWLAESLDLQPGMRVLDLGCGRAVSSIFLRREFGVQVWATDPWRSACETTAYKPGELSRFWPSLIEPLGRVYFVGAYADNLNWGMEAGTRSANRIAEAIDKA